LTAGGNDEIKNTDIYLLDSAHWHYFPFLFTTSGDGNENAERRSPLLEGIRLRAFPGTKEKP
jgi:hypothetical protein